MDNDIDNVQQQYLKHREDSALRSSVESLYGDDAAGILSIGFQPAVVEEDSEIEIAPAGETVEPATGDELERIPFDIARDVFGGIVETPLRSIPTGALRSIRNSLRLADKVGSAIVRTLPDSWQDKEALARSDARPLGSAIPEEGPLGAPKTATGNLTAGIAQFVTLYGATGAIQPLRALAGLGTAGRVGSAVLRGGTADFVGSHPHEERLSNLVLKLSEEYPVLKRPIFDALAAKDTDGEVQGRLKAALEGFGLGAMSDAFFWSLRGVAHLRDARAKVKTSATAKPSTIPGIDPARIDELLGGRADDDFILTKKDLVQKLDAAAEGMASTKQQKAAASKKAKVASVDKATQESAGMTPEGTLDTATPNAEVFINFSRINSVEDVQRLMQIVADDLKPSIDEARGPAPDGIEHFKDVKLSAQDEDGIGELFRRRAEINKGNPNYLLNSRQTVAARQVWVKAAHKLRDLAKEAAVNPSAENIYAFRRMMGIYHAIQKEILSLRADQARALNSWKIETGAWGNDNFAKQLDVLIRDNGGLEVNQDLAQRIVNSQGRELDVLVDGSIWAKTKNAVKQLWINSLLSSPTTHVANTMSNLAELGVRAIEKLGSAATSSVLGTSNGVEWGEALAYSFGAIQGFKDMAVASVKAARNWELPQLLDEEASKYVKFAESTKGADNVQRWGVQEGSLSASTLGLTQDSMFGKAADFFDVASRTPGRALRAGDDFAKMALYRAELNALAYRQGLRKVRETVAKDPEAWAALTPKEQGKLIREEVAMVLEDPANTQIRLDAGVEALKATYGQAPNETMIKALRSVKKMMGPLLGNIVIPFENTPVNIFTGALERSPMAPLLESFRTDVMAGGAKSDAALAKMALGTLTTAAVMDLALNGMISGQGPRNAQERAALQRTGWQPRSIKIGGTWYSYDRIEPFGMLLGVAADTAELAANVDDDDKTVGELVAGISLATANNFTSKSWSKGIAEFLAAVHNPEMYGESWIEGAASGFVPAGLGALARAEDPYLKHVRGALDAIRNKVPNEGLIGWLGEKTFGTRGELEDRLDLWGRKIAFQDPASVLWQLSSPIRASTENPEPIDVEMKKLRFFPGMPSKTITVGGVELSLKNNPKAYYRLVKLAGDGVEIQGQTCLQKLNHLVTKDPKWNRKDFRPEDKANHVQKIISRYRGKAEQQLLQEFPELRARYDIERRKR